MGTQDGGHRHAAIAAIAEREYETAGDEYTRAGRRVLADPRPGVDPFEADEKGWTGIGLGYLAVAGICYRVCNRSKRATRRSVEGIAIARDLGDTMGHPIQQACFSEFVADFRAIAGMDDVSTAYESAEADYEAAGDSIDQPQKWAMTPVFEAAIAPIQQVARSLSNGEIAVEWETLHGSDPSRPGAFLSARPAYKRQRFPSMLERLFDSGFLAAPRGTTAYGTDHHQCPNCGSTDVNWVGDNTLCLRCSRPSDPQ